MQMLSSARLTCSASLSASLNTATVPIPISLHARMMRTAISPRLAIRILENTERPPSLFCYLTSAKLSSPLAQSLSPTYASHSVK